MGCDSEENVNKVDYRLKIEITIKESRRNYLITDSIVKCE